MRRTAHGVAIALLLQTLLQPGASPARAQDPGPLDDVEFIESLESSAGPVDRRRMAKLFFGVAASLTGGKRGVRVLQGRVVTAESNKDSVRAMFQGRYEGYVGALAGFHRSVSELLDDPDSNLLLHRVLVNGQRTCWQLDLHTRLLYTYGAGDADLITILSSLEACALFRSAAFQPRIERILTRALAEPDRQRDEIGALRQEISDLEQLVEDLRRIDEAD